MTIYWEDKLTSSDWRILDAIDDRPDGYHNPICDAIQDGRLETLLPELEDRQNNDVTIKGLSRLATICQMMVYDQDGGPDGDHEPKALRRHWYHWYKVDFAQPLSQNLLGQDIQESEWGGRWASYLSQTYADLVDNEDVTYKDLWVKDASRMMEIQWEQLFRGSHIVVCVEKDSLFEDFLAPSRALGAKVLLSGKGKNSKAATEKMLREAFRWSEDYDPFEYHPLHVLHISDFDYDGEEVIGPTFAEQCRRYTLNVREARIGVEPIQLQEQGYSLQDKSYEVKMSHSSSKRWAFNKALKMMKCESCGSAYLMQRGQGSCQECGNPVFWYSNSGQHKYGEKVSAGTPKPNWSAFGFEIESMRTRDYYLLMVDALLSIMPLSEIIAGLRDDCQADNNIASERIADEICSQNTQYAALEAEMQELQERLDRFRQEVIDWFMVEGEGHESDWRELEDDPDESDLRTHVSNARRYSEPWRPFRTSVRTNAMVDWFHDEYDWKVDEFIGEEIE